CRVFKQRLMAAVRDDFAPDAKLLVIKDPRATKLVPLWLSILHDLNRQPLAVIPIRNPLEVASSLKIRDGFSEEKAVLLWLNDLLAAERHTRAIPRSFVCFDNLLDNWRDVIRKIGDDLKLKWSPLSPAVEAEIGNFLSAPLRHHIFNEEELSIRSDIVGWV